MLLIVTTGCLLCLVGLDSSGKTRLCRCNTHTHIPTLLSITHAHTFPFTYTHTVCPCGYSRTSFLFFGWCLDRQQHDHLFFSYLSFLLPRVCSSSSSPIASLPSTPPLAILLLIFNPNTHTRRISLFYCCTRCQLLTFFPCVSAWLSVLVGV